MKKLFLPLAIALFAAVSCNKTETQTEKTDAATAQVEVHDSVVLAPDKERVNAADSSKPFDSLRTGDVQVETDSAR